MRVRICRCVVVAVYFTSPSYDKWLAIILLKKNQILNRIEEKTSDFRTACLLVLRALAVVHLDAGVVENMPCVIFYNAHSTTISLVGGITPRALRNGALLPIQY